GENVKQSNWGDLNSIRFPQTRMGVEQTMYDAFIRAKDYKLFWEKYSSLNTKDKAKAFAPRRDLELDALVEILDKKRFITCHSYVQSEINMLMHVGDSMGFTVNTFTHILEGYKVADKMKARGINASSFSDWWAYKYEVYDAIPYNPAMLAKVGVNTAVNSDDAEMARRLNQEAAKSIKYGGLTEEEAWKLCTLNPAKMLRVDDRVGSIKVGKDADVVLWNNNPLSIYANCEITLVDGIMFYNEKDEIAKADGIQKERTRLMNKMLQAKQNGETAIKPAVIYNREWDCDSMTDGHDVGKKN
ncbi:MAG: amidohydrolase family protein, partial [Chitinophagales bacterium]|nr:amidohydrolase family protein [Chitinophagales bacterium]